MATSQAQKMEKLTLKLLIFWETELYSPKRRN